MTFLEGKGIDDAIQRVESVCKAVSSDFCNADP